LVPHERVDLVEAAGVEQLIDSLTCGEFALPVLRVDASLTATE